MNEEDQRLMCVVSKYLLSGPPGDDPTNVTDAGWNTADNLCKIVHIGPKTISQKLKESANQSITSNTEIKRVIIEVIDDDRRSPVRGVNDSLDL